jgi:pimeloyl-ACP methyl ester carboxylesterase
MIQCCVNLFFLLSYLPVVQAYDLYILVHGTWGSASTWHKPHSLFWQALRKNCDHNARIVSFAWSGSNSDSARHAAAQELAALLLSYPSNVTITVIAHSHGGNVVLLASQYMHKKFGHSHKPIQRLFLLGTPIACSFYEPNFAVINVVYNFFSWADIIQPILGMFERVLPAHPCVANCAIMVDAKELLHTELMDWRIAQWLSTFPGCLKVPFKCEHPGIINFFTSKHPQYSIDTQRDELLKEDKLILERLIDIRVRSITPCHNYFHVL